MHQIYMKVFFPSSSFTSFPTTIDKDSLVWWQQCTEVTLKFLWHIVSLIWRSKFDETSRRKLFLYKSVTKHMSRKPKFVFFFSSYLTFNMKRQDLQMNVMWNNYAEVAIWSVINELILRYLFEFLYGYDTDLTWYSSLCLTNIGKWDHQVTTLDVKLPFDLFDDSGKQHTAQKQPFITSPSQESLTSVTNVY